LTFGHNFNQPLLHLPAELQDLVLGHDFNQELVDAKFPASLRRSLENKTLVKKHYFFEKSIRNERFNQFLMF